jgi:hypothetical protein
MDVAQQHDPKQGEVSGQAVINYAILNDARFLHRKAKTNSDAHARKAGEL